MDDKKLAIGVAATVITLLALSVVETMLNGTFYIVPKICWIVWIAVSISTAATAILVRKPSYCTGR